MDMVFSPWSTEPVEESTSPSLSASLFPLLDSSGQPTDASGWCPSYVRYKTELCSRYAITGTCKYNERCQFAHGLQELRVPSQHPKYKTELCHTFHTCGFCPYGPRCLFVHDLDEQKIVRQNRSKKIISKYKTEYCRTFASLGVCPYGTRCHFIHNEKERRLPAPQAPSSRFKLHQNNYKKEQCRNILTGFCPYGARCHFLHNQENNEVQQAEVEPFISANYCSKGGAVYKLAGRSLSPSSDGVSTSSGTPDYCMGSISPVPTECSANNAFTFTSQQITDLLLPLAIGMQE
ncbi:mRNA decay activator protein ZFP36L2-like isoform X2 [Protopterus annectens]|nr:mRNA decay activator protein ZFP36L2-like isoform X2 [Protopterus annectens]